MSNADAFRLAAQTTFQQVVSAATGSASDRADAVRDAVRRYNDNVYVAMMGAYLFASDETPAIILSSQYGDKWAGLSPDYHARKASEGFDVPAHWRRTGDLARALSGRSGNKDFGSASVSVSMGGQGFDDQNFKKDTRGRIRYKAGTSRGGQFAPSIAAYRDILFSIQAELFPKLEGQKVGEQFIRSTYPQYIGKKLGPGEFGRSGGKGRSQPARPLLRPFLDWYTTENFKNYMNEQFGLGAK